MTIGQALDRLRERCSRCEYSTGQVRKMLHRWDIREKKCGKAGFVHDEIEEAVGILVSERYVDDVRFAGAYVRDKARFAKWGPAKIAYNMKALGIEKNVIEDAIRENGDLFDDGVLREMVARKWYSLKQEEGLQSKRAKVLRFALGRGFSYEQIMEAIKDLG